jgi:hypothetical protein
MCSYHRCATDDLRHTHRQWNAKRLLKALFRLRRVSALKTSSPNGIHLIGLAPQNAVTSVSAGHEPICGPGWT